MITVERFVNELMSSNCYLVVDEASKHCICIDPASEKSFREIEYIERNGLTLDYIILTHEHTDHTWGCNALVERFGSKVICSEVCKQNLANEFQAYFLLYYDNLDYHYSVCQVDYTTEELGNELEWHGHKMEFIKTPGHSMGSICVLVNDILFSGDTIMQSKPYINKRNGSKEIYLESINLILNRFDNNQRVYPGHGEVFTMNEMMKYNNNKKMDSYIKLKEIPSHLGLKRGGVVFVSSDIVNLGTCCMEHGERFNLNVLIDAFLEAVGPEGTLVFPTYNWSFCKGETFDYYKTKCLTGALGTAALKRPEFRRTKHPIYSFAVAGKYQNELCSMENVSSFGSDSPFAFFEKVNAQNVLIDVIYSHCFTFMHYFEQKYGISYRYEKMFSANYIDDKGNESRRSYSMFVRDLDLDVINDLEEMGREMEKEGVAKIVMINNLPFRVVKMGECDPLFKEDILNNRSRKISKYKGQ